MFVGRIDHHLDLRGKAVPYPALDARHAVMKMARGQVLEIVTDHYPARQTIPRSMKELGHSCQMVESDAPVLRFIVRKC